MQQILFAFTSYFGWGTGDIFGTIATRKIGAYSTAFWIFTAGVVIFSLYIPFAWNDLGQFTLPLLVLNVVLGSIYILGNVSFNEALRVSNASLVGTIAASFASVTLLLSITFLGESINANQALSIATIFLGVLLATLNFKDLKTGQIVKDKGVIFAFVSMVTWGVYFAFVKILVQEVGWFWPNYISFCLFPLIYLYMRVKKIKLEKPNYKGALIPVIASAILLRSGDFSFNFALSSGLAAIIAPVAGAYPTLFVVLAFLVFKDPITRQQIAGILVTLIGIVLLSVFNT